MLKPSPVIARVTKANVPPFSYVVATCLAAVQFAKSLPLTVLPEKSDEHSDSFVHLLRRLAINAIGSFMSLVFA